MRKVKKPTISILSLDISLVVGSYAISQDNPAIFIGFKMECFKDTGGKKDCDFFGKNDPLYRKYRLILLNRHHCFLSTFPTHIQGNDTIYSASDGGFFSGPCKYRRTKDSLYIQGKYDDMDYIAMKDSTYSFSFGILKKQLTDRLNGLTLIAR